ncbi:cell division protein FtsA [Acutalibacter sp. 1XD8-33]|nr:cell division protein FtsA [Acutalibacter sp. 1XD8-33]
MPESLKKQDAGTVFALDIGTRSIIGMLGQVEEGRFHVEAIEKEEHGRRAMLDGQIVEIEQVAAVAQEVIHRLESKTGTKLGRVCVAAAGRALKSQSASFRLQFDDLRRADADVIGQLEAGAVSEAEKRIAGESAGQGRFYMVGYTARQYVVDGYPMMNLLDHRGRVFEADVVSTFLPSGVVESLYAVTNRLGLEVSSLTLEPIAALNAAIPSDIRLLNLVLVDIGAGTSDIAVCREGSVVGYTMATVAGDEITELLMRSLLVDFKTGERLKMGLGSVEPLQYPDILGVKHEISSENLYDILLPAAQRLAKEIAAQIMELNGGVPSAVFLAGGGSKLMGLTQLIAAELEMSEARVALAGNHFGSSAWSDEYELNDPEYATPLGIGASAALGMINDSYMVTLNGFPAKLFRNGALSLRDVLLMNGYHYGDMMGRTGGNLSFTLNGQREFFRGMPGVESKMSINDREAEFSTVVQAGDRIQFTPAKPGKAATQTLFQLLGQDFSGTVMVNGQPVEDLAYEIRQGDAIETAGGKIPARRGMANSMTKLANVEKLAGKERADAAETATKKPEETVSRSEKTEEGLPVAQGLKLAEKEEKEAVEKQLAETVELAASKPENAKPALPQRMAIESKKNFQPPAREEKPVQREKVSQKELEAPEQLSFGGGMRVMLNGEPIQLKPKAQGGDYYLMDLLELSGLDFSHLDRPVDLLVNGAEGQFSQILRRNDQVTIKYRE